jgi:hypothetical protein
LGLLDFLKGLLGGSGKKKAKKKAKKRKPPGGKALRDSGAASKSAKSGSRAKGGQFARKEGAAARGTGALKRPVVDNTLADSGRELVKTVPAADRDDIFADQDGFPEASVAKRGTGALQAKGGTGTLDPSAADAAEAPAPPKKEKKGGFFGFGGGPKKNDRKVGALLKELDSILTRGDFIGLKLKLDDAAATATAYRTVSEEKIKNFGTARTQLKYLIDENNYQAMALAAATLAGEAAFLGDPVVKKAGEIMDLMPFVLKAAKSKKNEAYGLINDLEKLLMEFNELLVEKANYLEKVGDEILKSLAQKDFAKVTGQAEAIVRDAEILAHQYDSGRVDTSSQEEQGVTASGAQEKWKDIDKQVLQLSQVLLAKQYRFSSDLAKIVSASAGVMGDPAFAKAVELIKGGKQLLVAFREQKVALVGKMATNLSRQAGVFNAPLMSRTNQIAEHCGQLEKLQKDKDWDKVQGMAIAITRTAALLTDPTIRKASLLSGDLSKVEVYIKRKDFAGALSTLAASVD